MEQATTQLEMLKELANIRDDPAAFERFADRWPVLAAVRDDYEPSDETPEERQAIYEQKGYWTLPIGGKGLW